MPAMKRLMYLVIIVALPLIAYFEYDHYVRHHPPVGCEYAINAAIDTQYYDPKTVQDYYESAEAVSTYARYLWKKHKIDVLSDNPADGEKAEALRTHRRYLATARYLEGRLLRAAELKALGFSNDEIRYMEQQQVKPEEMQVRKFFGRYTQLQIGDQNQTVMDMQKLLNAKGYTLRIDGIFNQETRQVVQKFQESAQLFPSGVMDDITLRELLK